ncbi:MAG: response regulator [Candidatus Levybacteria bacterium]|nr:response regulator [Candidatus Levybacteria bacterium]
MRILLIDDDVFFQKFYATKLSEKGYEVHLASDGNEGIEKARTLKPNIILLDIIMPGKDGFETLKVLSNDKVTKDIPVLVFSTLGQQQDVKKALDLGAKGYANKTFFDFDNLVTRIASLTKQ